MSNICRKSFFSSSVLPRRLNRTRGQTEQCAFRKWSSGLDSMTSSGFSRTMMPRETLYLIFIILEKKGYWDHLRGRPFPVRSAERRIQVQNKNPSDCIRYQQHESSCPVLGTRLLSARRAAG